MDALIREWAAKGKLRCGHGKGSGYRFSTRINGSVEPTYRFVGGVLVTTDDYESDISAQV